MKQQNLTHLLEQNSYPGRGIVLGITPDGTNAALAYFIMGRSAKSRSRAFVKNGDDLSIRILDENAGDTGLILYTPLRTLPGVTIVTNGDQTDTIFEALKSGRTFEAALTTRSFEPDAPHFTPRISGLLLFDGAFSYRLSILKAGDPEGKAALRQTFSYEPVPGVGHFIHTYAGDGAVLSSFSGEPVPVALPDGIDAFANSLWDALDAANKISLYVRYTNLESGAYEDRLFNRYTAKEK